MWILIVSFCTIHSGGTACNSFIPTVAFRSEIACRAAKSGAAKILSSETKQQGRELIWAKITCEDVGAGA